MALRVREKKRLSSFLFLFLIEQSVVSPMNRRYQISTLDEHRDINIFILFRELMNVFLSFIPDRRSNLACVWSVVDIMIEKYCPKDPDDEYVREKIQKQF